MPEPFDSLTRSFIRSLRARNLSEKTIKTYQFAVNDLAKYAATERKLADWDAVTKEIIQDHLGAIAQTRKPGGVSVCYRGLQQFFKWAAEEEEIAPYVMAGMKSPIVPEPETPVLREEQIKALFKTCEGTDFRSRRDTAILRFFLDTGARLEEVAGLPLDRLDVDMCEALVMGKGRRARTVAFGKRSAVALDRYLRVRAKHKHGKSNDLWLAERTGPVSGAMTGDGIYQMIRRRGEQIGAPWLRPHILRHTWAHQNKLEGRLHDDELQRLAGWRSRQMLARYGASVANARALDAGKRTALGDRL
jgi:site-specific recombinase XerD